MTATRPPLAVDEHTARILSYTASYARSHASAYTRRTRSGYFYLRRFDLVDRELASLAPGRKILDIGSGAGHASTMAARSAHSYTGVDLSPEMVAAARAAQFNPAATFTVGAVEDLPFPTDSFDVVLALGVLEYVHPDRLDRALQEIGRVLRPNGVFIVSLLNRSSPAWVTRELRRRASVVRSRLLRRHRPEPFPERLFTRGEVAELMTKHAWRQVVVTGFSMIAVSEAVYAAHPERWARHAERWEDRGAGLLGRLAMGHLLVAAAPGDGGPRLPRQQRRHPVRDRRHRIAEHRPAGG